MNRLFRKMTDDIYLLETPAGGVWSGIVFVDGKEKVLIDSGENAAHIDELLIPALRELGYGLEEVDWLCNTHCHGDHVGGHRRIVELAGTKVAAYRKSVPKLRDPLKYSRLIRAAYPADSPPAPAVLDGVKEDTILEDGSVVAGRLQVVAAPGHDDDCICFLDLASKTLISGDSLQGNGTRTQGTALYMDLGAYRSTLNRLMGMEIKNIISAHPYLFSGESAKGEKECGIYLEKCMEITRLYEEYIRLSLQAGERDTVEIAKGLIDHMGNERPAWLFQPLYTVDAHRRELQKGLAGGNTKGGNVK
ncbi:MAG TPA: MBL fold metallo-hydrolase [Candidatus Eisenbergiella merdipullorum]|uniref:MBL fold metallo-hydrolase n=1 Tax=Candidatus Eisenbergiella merdipullorum TaxID=2838553 RepID=A0A9D2KYQ2_9FIRM|nr:MBL fold metallo-hydrolase [Candidatus Eisenbergiella merdipullorum]